MSGTKPTDGPQNNPPRNLCESKHFTEEKNKLLSIKGCKRLDEVLQGIDIPLCRNPRRYPIAVEGTELRLFKTRGFTTIPSFKIWYRFDDTQVELLHIELSEEE